MRGPQSASHAAARDQLPDHSGEDPSVTRQELHATVLPADISLDATPDMESRVVIRSVAGSTLNSHNHSSPRGANGYYVDQAQWSPDSQFFVYSLVSSGGHSPWSHPTHGLQRCGQPLRQSQRHDRRVTALVGEIPIRRASHPDGDDLEEGRRARRSRAGHHRSFGCLCEIETGIDVRKATPRPAGRWLRRPARTRQARRRSGRRSA
jgi:hypothetical protein